MDLQDDSRTWPEIEAYFLSYFRPRMLSAGKLVLRGVQMDSHPLSMNDCSEFLPYTAKVDQTGRVWDDAAQTNPRGWAPMVVFNPSNETINLLVTVEWRVRFDIANPAVSSHRHHGVSTDQAWDQHIRRATDSLPGVVDIVEKVASTGMALKGAASLFA